MAEDTIGVTVVADTRQAIANLADFSRTAVGLVNDLARLAHEAQEGQNAIRQLGGAYDRVQAATSGVVSAQQALRAQQQLSEAGMQISDDGLASLARRARDYANATNTDLTTALDRVTNAIRTGSAPALQQLGVHLDRNARGGNAAREALRQWREQQRGAAPEAQNLAEAADANARAWREFTTGLAATAAQAINLRGILNSLREATGGLGEAVRNGLAAFGVGAGGEETQRRNTERQTEQLRLQIAETAARQGAGRIAGLDRLTTAQLYSIRDRLARGENPNAVVGDGSTQGRAAIAADQARAHAPPPPDLTGGPRGGGGGSNPLREAIRAAGELRRTAAAADMLDAVDDLIEKRPGESPTAWNRRLALLGPGIQQAIQEHTASQQAARQAAETAHQQATAARLRSVEAQGQQIERQRAQNQIAVGQAQLGANFGTLSGAAQQRLREERQRTGGDITEEGIRTARAADDVGQQLQSTFQRTATFAQNLSGAVGAAFEGMTSSLTNHIQALVEGRENIGQAMLGIAHEVSMGIATRSIPLALFELASGVAAQAATLGVPNPIAAQHFASAAMFGALAAGGLIVGAASGAGLAAMNSGSQGGGGAAGGRDAGLPRGPASAGASGAGGPAAAGNVVIVNFNGAPIHTREEVQETVVSATNFGRMRGFATEAEVLDRRRRAA